MADAETNLPQVASAHRGEWASERAFREHFEPRFLCPKALARDYGADGHIERMRPLPGSSNRLATGQVAWFQLKHTSHSYRPEDRPVTYSIPTKNINYLGAYPCSFYLLFVVSTGALFFRWCRAIREELDRDRADWNTKTDVSVRFSRIVDEALLQEIEAEIGFHAEQTALLFDGPGFIRFARPEAIRRLFQPEPIFLGRQEALDTLARRIARGVIVPILGPSGAGKSELVRQLFSNPLVVQDIVNRLGGPIALLVVDVAGRLQPRFLRALDYSLGTHKLQDAADADDSSLLLRSRARLLASDWPLRVQGQHSVVVIEGAHSCMTPPERADLEDFLASEPLRTGCALVVGQWGDIPAGRGSRSIEAAISVAALEPEAAAGLFRALSIDTGVSADTIAAIRDLPELLLPGVIRRGSALFKTNLGESLPSATSQDLIDCLINATDQVARQTLSGLGLNPLDESSIGPTALHALLAMSVLGQQTFIDEDLHSASLSATAVSNLGDVGWVTVDGGAYRLTGFGYRSLRRELCRLLRTQTSAVALEAVVAEHLNRLLDVVVRRTREEDFDAIAQSIENAVVWARDAGIGGSRLEAILLQALLPYVVDDRFFPVSSDAASTLADSLAAGGLAASLAGAASDLTLAIRSNVPAREFLKRCHAAVDVAAAAPSLLAVHLKALDVGLFLAQRRYNQNRELLSVRRLLLARLVMLNGGEAADVALLKWSASWILNSAVLAISIGEMSEGRELTTSAALAVDRLPEPRTAYGLNDRQRLEYRLLKLQSLLSASSAERVPFLSRALEIALAALAQSPSHPYWVRRSFQAARRLSGEMRTDADRDEVVESTLRHLVGIFGVREKWSLGLRSQATAFLRNVAALNGDPTRRLEQTLQAIEILEPALVEANDLAQFGDAQPLLVLARTYAYAAACCNASDNPDGAGAFLARASKLSRSIVRSAPSAEAWELCLRLTDQKEFLLPKTAWHTEGVGSRGIAIGPQLRADITAAHKWLEGVQFWNESEGRLALWCQKRECQRQGSLERWAAQVQESSDPWETLNSARKREALSHRHAKRQAELDAIERKSGPFLDLYLERMRSEAECQRLLAVYGDHLFDMGAVLRHLEAARCIWPDDQTLLVEEGRCHRYTWNYGRAIMALRRVVKSVPDSLKRHEAAADLAEVLLAATTHCDAVSLDDGTTLDRLDLANEAAGLLSDLTGFRHVSRWVGVLRDRADLELGVALDWRAIDEAFEVVVGGVGAYAATVVSHLDELRGHDADNPEHVAGLVLNHFTEASVLRGLGSLYLRRVELGASPDPRRDCGRAYAAFHACEILEVAFSGSGKASATSSYQRGRTIMAATRATGSAIPFEADLEGKRSLVHLAETLFSRTVALTVGMFHAEAKRRQSEASILRRTPGFEL